MLAVAAVAVGTYFLVHLNDEIRTEVQRILSEHYAHLEVRVGDARLIEGRGIEVRDLSLRQRGEQRGGPPLLEIEEVFLACPVQIKQLLNGLPPLRQVVIRRPHLRIARQQDGSWNINDLAPLPKAGPKPVEIVVQKGVLEVRTSPSSNQSVAFRELSGVLRPATRSAGSPGRVGEGYDLAFALSASGPLCRQVKLSGRLAADRRIARFAGELNGLILRERDLAGLPGALADHFRGLQQLRGSLRLDSVELHWSPQTPLQLAASVQCEQVAVQHEALPDPIVGMTGAFTYGTSGLHAHELTGKCGSANVAMSFHRQGWTAKAPFTLSARISGLDLRQRHWHALPLCMQEVWEKYHAQGRVDIPLCEISYDGGRIHPNVKVSCRDVLILSEKFRYPLRHVRGSVVIGPAAPRQGALATVQLRLQGQAAGQTPIAIEGEYVVDTSLDQPPALPVGWTRVAGSGVVVDEELLAALPEGPQRFVRDLRPQGKFGFVYETRRHDATQDEPEKQLELTLQGGTVNYVKFPYPLHDLRGEIRAKDGRWDFVHLTAGSTAGSVSCTGTLRPRQSAGLTEPHAFEGAVLELRFDANRVELDSTLRQALATLSPNAQVAWDVLNPSGRVNASVDYRHILGSGKPQIQHSIEPVDGSVSIKPTFFPYRIDQLEGKLHLRGSRVTFEKMRGRHGPTTIIAGGSFHKVGEGGWALQLNDLSVDRLTLEKELLSALPGSLARLVTRLNPQGQVSLAGSSIRLSRDAQGEPIETNWRLHFDVHQASLDCGVHLDSISGGIQLAGHGRGTDFTTDGELTLDSVRWNRFFASAVEGPLYADATQVLLGQEACLARHIPPRRITADAYGGKLAGDAAVTLGAPSRFSVTAEYQGGDLRRLITETWPTRENVQGEIYGRLDLQGISQSPETVRGEGAVAIRNAELYELPQLIRLFKALRGREPDRTAFTQADTEFEISGRLVGLKYLRLNGDAVALHGRGTVDFDQRLNLTFYSELAPSNATLAGLRSLMRQASNQVMRLHVQGTIANPRFVVEPLAGLNDALQQIQSELGPQARLPRERRRAWGLFGGSLR